MNSPRTRCVGLGFKRPRIALITYRGRENSKLMPYDKLGPYTLRAPTGKYDLLGNATFTDGDLLIDSVHRFKGRASPCVVFTEIDFETLDDTAVRRLFVGATRATIKLILAVSERSARVLMDRVSIGLSRLKSCIKVRTARRGEIAQAVVWRKQSHVGRLALPIL